MTSKDASSDSGRGCGTVTNDPKLGVGDLALLPHLFLRSQPDGIMQTQPKSPVKCHGRSKPIDRQMGASLRNS